MTQRADIPAKICRAIERRGGEPVSREALCRWLDIPDRTLREVIRELNIRGFPIVPIERKPGGYKWGTEAECRVAAKILRAKATSLFERAHGLEPKAVQEALW